MDNQQEENLQAKQGTAKVQFLSQYAPIQGLSYRLRVESSELVEGQTDAQGFTETIMADGLTSTDSVDHQQHMDKIHVIQTDNESIPVSIEVKRDNGSWKYIGSFNLEKEKEKLVYAEIDTVVLPFKLAPIKEENNTKK